MRVNWNLKEGRELKERLKFLAKDFNNYAAVDSVISAMEKLHLVPHFEDVERFLAGKIPDYENTYMCIPYEIIDYIIQMLYTIMEDIKGELKDIRSLSKSDFKYTLLGIYAILYKCVDLIEERGFSLKSPDIDKYHDEVRSKIDEILKEAITQISSSLDSLKEHISDKLKEDIKEISRRVRDGIEDVKRSFYRGHQ